MSDILFIGGVKDGEVLPIPDHLGQFDAPVPTGRFVQAFYDTGPSIPRHTYQRERFVLARYDSELVSMGVQDPPPVAEAMICDLNRAGNIARVERTLNSLAALASLRWRPRFAFRGA